MCVYTYLNLNFLKKSFYSGKNFGGPSYSIKYVKYSYLYW